MESSRRMQKLQKRKGGEERKAAIAICYWALNDGVNRPVYVRYVCVCVCVSTERSERIGHHLTKASPGKCANARAVVVLVQGPGPVLPDSAEESDGTRNDLGSRAWGRMCLVFPTFSFPPLFPPPPPPPSLLFCFSFFCEGRRHRDLFRHPRFFLHPLESLFVYAQAVSFRVSRPGPGN